MFKILDRYLVREIALPFAIALVVLTFVLMIPPIVQRAESLIARGVEFSTVATALMLLAPSQLSLTIPMAVLLGILVGFGRVSADREFMMMQACGVSLMRLLRPVALVALVGTAATAYQIIVALPGSNQAFREIVASVSAERLESAVSPRVFFDEFPRLVIYVRDLPPEGGWRGVFVGDETRAGYTTIYFAQEGRIRLDKENELVQLQLLDGTSHTTSIQAPETLDSTQFESISLALDPAIVFKGAPPKGAPEMTFAELRASIAEAAARGAPAYAERFMIQYKFAFPLTCPILALIGLALGASNHKGGRLASFVLGFGVILVYYVLVYGFRAFAMGGRLSPEWGAWLPNVIMAAGAVVLMAWRTKAGDRPLRFTPPAFWRSRPPAAPDVSSASRSIEQRRLAVKIRAPHVNVPLPRLLDLYLAREYSRVFALGVVSFLGIFYISTFIDMIDKLFRGETTTAVLGRYFFFETPQFVYFVIPISVLVATLVTIGVMTKNSELLIMRACGISLFRTVAPLVVFALAASVVLFALQERVLAYTNREADRLEAQIRGLPQPVSELNRQWKVGLSGDIYHYELFNPVNSRFTRLRVYDVDERSWRLRSMTNVTDADFTREVGLTGPLPGVWHGHKGWRREFTPVLSGGNDAAVKYTPIADEVLLLEPPSYFISEVPLADQMTYGQLREYISQLRASGANIVPYAVALHRKVSFPFVTVIMTLLAVPFAITTGRRGAPYGIGIGILLGIFYFLAMSLFGAFGSGGLLAPVLAAWAPNILFGAAAVYMMLTVRT